MRRAILLTTCAALAASGCGSAAKGPASTARTARSTTTPGGRSHLAIIGTPRFGSPSPSAPVRSGHIPISYRYFTVDPAVIRVKAGSTVEWTNSDPGPDNVTSVDGPQSFASKDLAEGATFSVRLTRPGVIHYESTRHPATINGTIQVLR